MTLETFCVENGRLQLKQRRRQPLPRPRPGVVLCVAMLQEFCCGTRSPTAGAGTTVQLEGLAPAEEPAGWISSGDAAACPGM
jgi:hypothetical protein